LEKKLNKVLNTSLYNQLYYDFLDGYRKVQNFLPDFRNVNWREFTKSIYNQNSIYANAKEVIIKDNLDITSDKGLKNLKLLKNDNTVFIITGQQLGLLASPLYTIYKIITSIKLAEQLNSQNLGYNYIPLFWLESEDHDFDEIDHFGIWNKKFEPQNLTYQGESRGKTSIKHYTFESQIEELIEQLKHELISTEFTEDLFEKLNKTFKSGKSWLYATREILKDIFVETGILFFKPGNLEIKEISMPFFKKVIENSSDLNINFRDVSNELIKKGYANQVTVVEGKTFLFMENNNLQREHIYFDNNGYSIKDSRKKFGKNELFEIINNYPEKISTSVISRPLLQSWLLPTVAYVAGPGEIAYWAQIGGMFDQMSLRLPVVYPRISAAIVEPKIQRFINKYELDIENLPRKQKEFVNQVLIKYEDNTFMDSMGVISDEMEKIKQKMMSVDPTLKSIFNKTSEKILGQIDFLEHKTLKAKELKEQLMVSQLQQIHAAFFPDEYPQERFLTFVYYLNKFGPEIISTIYEKSQLENFKHQIIEI
jgi:bacillithiol biosynthesis cysteine-adding enzyme BshC